MDKDQLKQIRELSGLTQDQFATALGYASRSSICMMESGAQGIKWYFVDRVKNKFRKHFTTVIG